MTTRPTPEQRATYETAWASYRAQGDSDDRVTTEMLNRILRIADPQMTDFIREQFVAACFLEDHLRAMDTTTEDYRKERCFTFGRMCLGRDPWVVFDKVLPHCQETHRLMHERMTRFSTPIVQDVPPPTKLLTGWYEYAKQSRGDRGVYPQVFFHQDETGALTIEALALNGKEAFDHVASVVRTRRPAEFVMGIDMSSLPGQELTREDFLAVVWGVGPDLYSGIIEYEPTAKGDAFDPIRWDNAYWNHVLHEDYFPKLRETTS